MTEEALRKSIIVRWSQEEAFRRFTSGIASWWPVRSHSVGGDRTETVVFEGRVGGRIYEKIRGGQESTWGTLLAWEPPSRVRFTWHPGRSPEGAQEVEVSFVPLSLGTRLELVHTGWERLGVLGPRARKAYAIGWAYVLRVWADRRSSPVVLSLDALGWLLSPLQKRLARRFEAAAAGDVKG
jgi:hypothetical protein